MSLSTLLLTNLSVIMLCVVALWLLSLPLKDASIVDIFWGPGFAIIAAVTFLLAEGAPPRMVLLTALTAAWGLRLGIYLAVRNIGHGEDPRYVSLRERISKRGNFNLLSLVVVFVFQGIVMLIVSLPVQLGQFYPLPETLGWLAWTGAALWLVGFLFEAIGDWQLMRFKKDPANQGKVLDSGLWRYTRHPNYFGNACIWWGLYLIAAEVPQAMWTAVGPVIMTYLLVRVTGAALLEKNLAESKPEYRDYVLRTSGFLPLPPRRPN